MRPLWRSEESPVCGLKENHRVPLAVRPLQPGFGLTLKFMLLSADKFPNPAS